MVILRIIGGICLDYVRPEFTGLSDERHNFIQIPIHLITADLGVGLEYKWFDH